MYKVFKSEVNPSPSLLNTSKQTGAASALTGVLNSQPNFDGVTIDDMRGNPLYSHCDDIDKVGIVQKKAIENYGKVKSKEKVCRKFNDMARKVNIPSKK